MTLLAAPPSGVPRPASANELDPSASTAGSHSPWPSDWSPSHPCLTPPKLTLSSPAFGGFQSPPPQGPWDFSSIAWEMMTPDFLPGDHFLWGTHTKVPLPLPPGLVLGRPKIPSPISKAGGRFSALHSGFLSILQGCLE